ncbi:MAG: pyrroline-5-carboxylate reductase [Novosphingobium sp.]|uniref:pyrroline-5-carboxylate reductase n=1 Tax=Novosphingobium sp. TaxID=1874826 RepID=UPI003C7E7A2B
MPDKKILILGCGNMGGAMLAGWLAAGLDPARFTLVDPFLAEAPSGVKLLREVPAGQFNTVLLGVKPQMIDDAAQALASAIGPQTVVLSILAGTEIASIAARLPTAQAIVRIMPNLAAAIGKSPLGLFGSGLDVAGKTQLEQFLAPLGTLEWLASEAQLDAVTALAGSGPAFVYRFIDALAAGGAALGLDPAQAARLALTMVEGAANLAAQADAAPAELAARVTSPGGTTAAGIAVLDRDRALETLVSATLRAACERGAELAAASRSSS